MNKFSFNLLITATIANTLLWIYMTNCAIESAYLFILTETGIIAITTTGRS
jgi:hypothetical protein